MKKLYLPLLLGITILGAIFRFTGLDSVPPHLSNDEISIAYDAYSLSHTSRDEHNQLLPLSFQSHNTYKAPLAIYLSVVPISLFGNHQYSPRLVSAALGSLTILLLGVLAYQLSSNLNLSLLSSLVLSLAPWHIHSSHMIYESNIAVFFLTLGLVLFFRGHQLSAFSSLALSLYAYHSEWLLTPALIASLVILYRKSFIPGIALFSLLLSLLAINTLSLSHSTTRANTEGLYNEPGLHADLTNPSYSTFRKFQILSLAIYSNYWSYYNLGFLFGSGLDLPPKPVLLQSGLFLPIFMPAFLIGLFALNKFYRPNINFFIFWLFFSPVVPALTKGGLNPVRNLASSLPISLVIAAGCLAILKQFRHTWQKLLLTLPLLIFLFFFCLQYYIHFPTHAGESFQYGYKQVADYLNSHPNSYTRVVIDPKFGDFYQLAGVPHLYILFFTQHSPQEFLRHRKDLPNGLYFDKFEIREIKWSDEKITPKTLFVSPSSNQSPSLTPTTVITYPNHQPVLFLYST